ncbi:MAG: hypothetical protein HQ518_11215, partial [Rhodopirellula sp.]|nr:hypothetical protein [Rhodopirellula sp.]
KSADLIVQDGPRVPDEIIDALEEVDPSTELRHCWQRLFPHIPQSYDSIMGWLISEHGFKRSEANKLEMSQVVELLKRALGLPTSPTPQAPQDRTGTAHHRGTTAKEQEPSQLFWDTASDQQKVIMSLILAAADRRVKRRTIESSDAFRCGAVGDVPKHGTVVRALNRLEEKLSTTATGWILNRSTNFKAFGAEVWLESPSES